MSAKHYFYEHGACYMNVLGEMFMNLAHGEFHFWGNAEDRYFCLPLFLVYFVQVLNSDDVLF